MACTDTVKLLRECDAGSKMAVTSIDEVLDYVCENSMRHLLVESKKHHEKLGNEIHKMLNEMSEAGKEPSLMAKGMSWIKTNMKLGMEESDETVAELITAGCDMGIRSLTQYLNEYEEAEHGAKMLCKKLIGIEEELRRELKEYL